MLLAKVTGYVIATQKRAELRGNNLLLVTTVDASLSPTHGQTFVAVDSVGAGKGDMVLVEKFSPSEKNPSRFMTIMAIVERVECDL